MERSGGGGWPVRNVQVHRFIALAVGAVFHEAGVAAFDLYTAASFLLNMLYVLSAVAHDLGAEVEARNWFEVDGDTFFGPFALAVRQ